MKTEEKITNKAIKLIESLGPSKTLILCVCCVLLGLIALIFGYWPLMVKLHNAANRLNEVQIELLNQRSAIAALDNSSLKADIMRQDDLSLAIAELTEKGRSLGLSFSSIAQQPLKETTQASIRKLPISFTIESGYKNAGQFLAYVEEFSHSIAEVESLSIQPRENSPTKLSVKLVLNLYLEI
jgi:Tfp pilus assembly protein PilO